MRAPLRFVLPALASFGLLACSSSDPITAQGLASSSVTTDKIADKSVTNPKLADGAVDARALGAQAVTPAAIADGAVGTTAIADNAVVSTSIADGSIDTSKIAAKAVATGSIDDLAVTTPKLNDLAVTTAKIADGSVTAAKLSSTAAVNKLNGLTGAVTLSAGQNIALTPSGNTISIGITGSVDSATLQGNDAATFARRDTHVITVSKSGGDFSTVQAAINYAQSGTGTPTGYTWPGVPSATNSYVVRVGPGTYTGQISMQQFVDVEGAGVNVTILTSPGQSTLSNPTVTGALNSELRHLTVQALGTSGNHATAFAVNGVGNGNPPTTYPARLTDVRLVSDGAVNNGVGAYVSAGALEGRSVSIYVRNAGANAWGAFVDTASKFVCSNCTISVPSNSGGSSSYALYNFGGGTIQIANSLVDSGVNGTAVCVNAYNASFGALGANCL